MDIILFYIIILITSLIHYPSTQLLIDFLIDFEFQIFFKNNQSINHNTSTFSLLLQITYNELKNDELFEYELILL